MATALVNNTQPIRWKVYYRNEWSDSWTYDRTLMPQSVVFAVAPTMPTARVIRDFGQVDDLELGQGDAILAPLDLRGNYFKIELTKVEDNGDEFEHTWYGYCDAPADRVDGTRTVRGNAVPKGRTTYNCYGLEWLLQKTPVLLSFDLNGDQINRSIPFNYLSRGRFAEVKGNRSENENPDQVYGFDAEGTDTWTGLDIVYHLLFAWGQETGVKLDWSLAFADDLDNVLDSFSFEGRNYYDAIRTVANAANGKTFYVDLDGGGNPTINVVSIVSQDIKDDQGSTIIQGNPAQVSLDIATDSDIRSAVIAQIENFHYDRIEVRGAPLRVCFTVGGSNTTSYITNSILVDGWTPALEADYNAADDKGRLQDPLETVFSRLKLPLDWNGKAGDEFALPAIDTSLGTPAPNPDLSFYYLRDKAFDRTLPIRDASGEQPRRPFAAWYDSLNKFHMVERPAKDSADADLTPVSLGVLDDTMGLKLSAGSKPNHIQGKNSLTGLTEINPEWDYKDMIATVSMYTDEIARVSVQVDNPAPGENESVKLINMPWCEVHYVVPGTVLAIDPDAIGEAALTRSGIDEAEQYPRNDSDKLLRAAYLAAGWYGIIRQIATITYSSPRPLDFLGAMLTDLDGDEATVEVNTLISKISYELGENSQEVTLQTEFFDLDIAGQFRREGGGARGGDFYHAGFGDMANIPVREGAAGSGGAGYTGPFKVTASATGTVDIAAGRMISGLTTTIVAAVEGFAFTSGYLYLKVTRVEGAYVLINEASAAVKTQASGIYYHLLATKLNAAGNPDTTAPLQQIQFGDIQGVSGRYV